MECLNWIAEMGKICNCTQCTECIILKFSRIDSSELVTLLCCASEHGTKLHCAEGVCLRRDCGHSKLGAAIVHGRSCPAFTEDVDFIVEFKRIQKAEVDGQDYKYVIHEQLPWKDFVWMFLDVARRHIRHKFVKRRQNGQRKIICREIDNQIVLRNNMVFSSIDFIGNKKLMCKSLTQGLATKLAQISTLVIYECRNIQNCIKESAHIY